MIANLQLVLREKGLKELLQASCYALLAKLAACSGRQFLRKRIHGCEMDLNLQDRGISRTLLLFGTREAEHRILLERVLKPGMTVFDVGANIGYYALMEKRLIGPTGKVVAAEPAPANAELLRRNLALNGFTDVPVLNIAISDQAGKRNFHLAEQSNLGSFHNSGTGAQHLTGQSIEVEMRTLADLTAEFGPPDLIRMDVEGHEVEILSSLAESIENGTMGANGTIAPMVLFETHLSRYTPDHDMEAPLRRLFKLGYRPRFLASSAQAGSTALKARGYKGGEPIHTDFVTRHIFENVSEDDTIDLICRTGGVRTVLLEMTS
jgi:FkbM family methyltransferase